MPAIPPSGSQPVQSSSPQNTVDDIRNYCNDLWNSSDYLTEQVGGAMLSSIQGMTDLPTVIKTLQGFFNCPNPNIPWLDFYMCYDASGMFGTETLLPQIVNQLNNIAGSGSFTVPPETTMDKILTPMAQAVLPDPPGPLGGLEYTIVNAMMNDEPSGVSSYGSTTTLLQYIDSLLTDPGFFSNYSFSYSDLQGFFSSLHGFDPIFTLPDFASYYFQLGQKSSPSSLENSLLQQMRTVWSSGSTASLLAWIPTLFSDYPATTLSDITTIAQDLGFTLPSSFSTTFNALVALLPADPSSADYKMIADFQHQWMVGFFANPNAWNAQTWFDNTYGTPGQTTYPPGITDLYLRYPGGSAPMIQSLVNIFFPSAPSYTATSFDNACRTIYANHGTETSGFWHDLIIAYQNAGSADNNQALEQWIDNVALSAFSSYPDMTVSDVMSFLSGYAFKITSTGNSPICDYVTEYISLVWEKQPGRTTDEVKFGNEVIAEIQAQEGGFSSLQDLKNYIATRISIYENQWKSIPPATITGLFELFGLYP